MSLPCESSFGSFDRCSVCASELFVFDAQCLQAVCSQNLLSMLPYDCRCMLYHCQKQRHLTAGNSSKQQIDIFILPQGQPQT